jgi:bifunctional DNase/RNase
MIEVVVSRLGLDSSNQSYVLILQEKDGTRVLPIWIGQAEAHSIVVHMHDVKHERPLTHDLCKSLILQLGGAVRRVQVTRVENSTYYGELHIDRGGSIIHVDSRPSDAIAIAIRLEAPIFAAESLLVEPGDDEDDSLSEEFRLPGASTESSELSAEQLKLYLEQLRPEDFGKFNL